MNDIHGRELTSADIGRAVVNCPGCGQERWHGLGPCSACGAPGTATIEAPARVCCGQRHDGPVCPDGLVMCCLCFERVAVDQLATKDGLPVDVCLGCEDQA